MPESTFDAKLFEIKPGTKAVIYLTVILGILVIVLALGYFFFSTAVSCRPLDPARATAAKDVYDAVVINTLLSMFKVLVTSVVGWVFGKPIVAAIAQRIAR